MSRKGPIRNLAASVHGRLLAKAKEMNRPFNEVFQHYAMERLLYRLSKSSHSKKFVLKGALMFAAWNVPAFRPTKDIDAGVWTSSVSNPSRHVTYAIPPPTNSRRLPVRVSGVK